MVDKGVIFIIPSTRFLPLIEMRLFSAARSSSGQAVTNSTTFHRLRQLDESSSDKKYSKQSGIRGVDKSIPRILEFRITGFTLDKYALTPVPRCALSSDSTT